MLGVAMRNLWDHKVRTALLGLAVVAGVGFVTASYVFTDSLSAAFDQAFEAGAAGTDIVVQPTAQPESGPGGQAFPRIDADLVDVVAEVEGVESARPFLQAFVTLVVEGEERPSFGPPDFAISWSGGGYFEIQTGSAPAGPDEIAIDSSSAESRGVGIGDVVEVAGASRAEPFEVVGTFGFREGGSGFGATFLAFTYERAADLLGLAGEVNSVEVMVEDDAKVPAVLSALGGMLPEEAEALDSRAAADEQAAQLQEGIGFFNTFLLVFGAIALVVGAFVVYNAFRVVVAQRSRELALLRVLGTTRRQLMWSVLAEALVVGVLASLIGVVVGLGLAVGIRSILAAVGTELPDAGLVLAGRTIVVALIVGVATTLLSALIPALRTTRISPMEALRDQAELRPIRPWWTWVGGLLLVVAVGLVVFGVGQAYDEAAITGNSDPLVIIGLGCLVAFGSFFLLARAMVRPMLGVIGG
ncbi:MAG: ABC transporter permease, partial [Acidimicrobiia bacterium]